MWKLWIYNIHVKIGMSIQPQGFSGPTVNHKVLLVEITTSFLPSSIKPLSNIYYILYIIKYWLWYLFSTMTLSAVSKNVFILDFSTYLKLPEFVDIC